MTASLKGIRVLEMSQIMAGPTCGLLLADLGAEVIKIEKTPTGDDTRNFLPPDINGEAAAFMMMNRNKKGIALNLKDKDGIKIFKEMVKNSDVVLENFRKGTLEKLGIGYDVMSEINPKIILCEISGYGRTGPYSDKGGFDLVAQGMSGLMSITGESKDKPPMKVGAPITDITAGLLASTGILAALQYNLEDHRVELELSKSEESDYISNGISLNYEKDYNLGNTTLALGFNYLDDIVKVPLLDDEKKDSYDFFVGVTQLLSKNTVISADLTLGYSEGYLNDPYKVVQRNEDFTIAPGVSVPIVNIYRENRPDSRFRHVLPHHPQH